MIKQLVPLALLCAIQLAIFGSAVGGVHLHNGGHPLLAVCVWVTTILAEVLFMLALLFVGWWEEERLKAEELQQRCTGS